MQVVDPPMQFMPQFMLVAFTGQDRAGKSTAAQMLAEHTGWPINSFASPLKQILRDLDPIVDGNFFDHELIPLSLALKEGEAALKEDPCAGAEYRHLMRRLGEAIKVHQPDYFADVWLRKAASPRTGYQLRRVGAPSGIIADDLRFPVEWNAMKSSTRHYHERAVLVRVINPRVEGGDHASQTMQEELVPDVVIENTGTLDDLKREIDLLRIYLMRMSREVSRGSR